MINIFCIEANVDISLLELNDWFSIIYRFSYSIDHTTWPSACNVHTLRSCTCHLLLVHNLTSYIFEVSGLNHGLLLQGEVDSATL